MLLFHALPGSARWFALFDSATDVPAGRKKEERSKGPEILEKNPRGRKALTGKKVSGV